MAFPARRTSFNFEKAAPAPPPGARTTPPLVGLQIYASNLQSSVPDPHNRYDANIMHRVVPPTLQRMVVTHDASSCDLAATFSLPVSYVAAHWLTSRSPMELPGYENAVVHPIQESTRVTLRRQPVSPSQLSSYRDLAVALTRKLEDYVQPQQSNIRVPTRPSRARIEKLHEQALAAIGDGAASSTSTISSNSAPTTTSDSLPARQTVTQKRTKERCGFSGASTRTHPDLSLSIDRKTLVKNEKGLYRCAKQNVLLNAGGNYYIEFHVQKNGGEGGMCIGLTSADAPLNRLVGTSDSSMGFHSSGKVVMKRGEWLPYGRPYGEGDTVGMLVEMPIEHSSDISSAESLSVPSGADNLGPSQTTNRTASDTKTGSLPRITFFINGQSQGIVPLQDDTFLEDGNDGALPLHATACLYRAGSSVEMKCCASDWEYFPSASAVCSGLRAVCHRRNSNSLRESIEEKQKVIGSRALGGCDSVLTP